MTSITGLLVYLLFAEYNFYLISFKVTSSKISSVEFNIHLRVKRNRKINNVSIYNNLYI